MSRSGLVVVAFCIGLLAVVALALATLQFGVCTTTPSDQNVEAAIKVFIDENDTILKLAIGLVVFAFAGLSGLRTELAVTWYARILLLLTCTLGLVGAYGSIVWRHMLAQVRLDGCPSWVLDKAMQVPFVLSFYAVAMAVATLGILGAHLALSAVNRNVIAR